MRTSRGCLSRSSIEVRADKFLIVLSVYVDFIPGGRRRGRMPSGFLSPTPGTPRGAPALIMVEL